MTDRGIRLTRSGVDLGDRLLPMIAGDCHYWRLERSKWPLVLEQFAELGFPILQTYVPWSVHETGQGQFDFGDFSPNKDLPAFLEMCSQAGLYVFLRPGPHINAELTYFGYPKRIFENPRNLAVSSTGGPVILPIPPRAFPAISYSSEHFFSELAVYFDAFAQAVAGHLYPNGPVIGIQADNEMSFFFRTATYDQDYSPRVRELYLEWVKEKYGELETLRQAYNRPLASYAELPMPTAFRARSAEDLPYYIDWAEFKEELLHRPLARIMGMLTDRGLDGLITYHNYPPGLATNPFNISRAERDFHFVGVDFYSPKTDFDSLKKRCLYLSGTSRFPVSPEFESGCYQAWAPIELQDQAFTTFAAMAFGLRGFNFYMAVERERWYGSPITRHGKLRENYAQFYRRLNRFINGSGIFEMEREVDALILRGRDYDRLEKAADLLSPLPPLVTEKFLGAAERCHEGNFGFQRVVQIDHETQFDAWYDGLSRARIPFAVSDTDIDPAILARYKVVFVPTFEFMGRTAQAKLREFAEAGGSVIMGPDVPALDELLVEFSELDHYAARPIHKLDCVPDTLVFNAGAGRIILVNGLFGEDRELSDRLVAEVCRHIQLQSVFPASAPCETSTFVDHEGRRIVFLINPTDQLRRPRIETGEQVTLRDLLTEETYFGRGEVFVDIDPYSVRPLEVLSC
jgi:Glycosyl hydrolases family 35/Beta-galactosidase trimerisation domain